MEATIGFKPGVWQKEINVSVLLETITQNIPGRRKLLNSC